MDFFRNGFLLMLGIVLFPAGAAADEDVPAWLPRYDLAVRVDVAASKVDVHEQITWTNRHDRPAHELVFNAHSRYTVPKEQIGFMAKTIELLRLRPSDALDTDGAALNVKRASLRSDAAGLKAEETPLEFHFSGETQTDLVVKLPRPVGRGETVTIVLESTLHLPQKQGRWGQWHGVTFLSTWLPVVAVYDDDGWHPTPFVAWHQPFFNEAGVYHAQITVPAEQHVACTGSVSAIKDLPDGWKQLSVSAQGVRDFALLCSNRYVEFTGEADRGPGLPPVKVRVLAFPEHEFYAKQMLATACETLPLYGKWFGPYPYPEFTLVESYFGWNGNECATLVMIDERVFGMPKLACNYIEYLVSHEICHQWWYNLVGTNGYCETWMDEALATHFSHRFMNGKHGKNNALMHYPKGLEWLPNIRREDYRMSGILGTIGRGEHQAILQEMPKFGHLANLFSLCYDKGARVVGMIEDRLGDEGFIDFIRVVQQKYRYRILRVEDFRRELEAYTGRSWEQFFHDWLCSSGLCDWAVEHVKVKRMDSARLTDRVAPAPELPPTGTEPVLGACLEKPCKGGPCRVVIDLCQKADICEQTVVGIALDKDDCFPIRVPVLPEVAEIDYPEIGATVRTTSPKHVRVEVILPRPPVQVTVDPDKVLLDKNPANNCWKKHVRWRFAPVYTMLEESDLTNAYDRANVLFGPWIYSPAYPDPWYTRSTLVGLRAGVFRTQQFTGGVYAAYRTDYRDIVLGADGLINHWPFPQTQVGFNIEQRLATFQDGRDTAFRASVFGRYVFKYTSSLYLQPMEYLEGFAAYQDNFLPLPKNSVPGAQRYDSTALGGLHFSVNYLTPYWDPQGGFKLDLTYAGGVVDVDRTRAAHQFTGQLSVVKELPDLTGLGIAFNLCEWLSRSRLAVRAYAAGGLPDEVEYFLLGGSTLFRGFDQSERQGSLVWVASLEYRMPLVRDVRWDCCDHVFGVRNVYGAAFYDVGDAYTRGRSVGPIAHAVGVGLRVDMAFFGFLERMTLRFDAAKTVNAATPWQFWFGVQQPF